MNKDKLSKTQHKTGQKATQVNQDRKKKTARLKIVGQIFFFFSFFMCCVSMSRGQMITVPYRWAYIVIH